MRVVVRFKGGAGSGHHGHQGRPGKRGGSIPGSGSVGTLDGLSGVPQVGTLEDLRKLATVELPPDDENYDYFYHSVRFNDELDRIVEEGLQPRYSGGSVFLSKDEIRDRGGGFAIVRAPKGTTTEGVDFVEQGVTYREWTTDSISNNNIIRVVREVPILTTRGHTTREDYLAAYAIDNQGADVSDIPSEWHHWFSVTASKEFFKGGPGSGHHGHRGMPGHQGGSLPGPGSPNYLPQEERVWQGVQHEGKRQMTNVQTGEIGEALASKALEDIYGVEFSTLNVGVNNAPIDLGGDHTAVEVKAGPATNVKTAHHWRATVSTAGKAERELIRQMTKEEKRAHNVWKGEQVLERKNNMLAEMSSIAGAPVKPVTVGVVLTADGSRGDVFLIPGFHLRLPWQEYASEDYYVGTYEYEG